MFSLYYCILEGGVDYKLLTVAIVLCLIVIGVVVGVVVGVTGNNNKSGDTTSSSSDSTTTTTTAPSTIGDTSTTAAPTIGDTSGQSPSTSIPIECTKSLMKFTETSLILKLAIDPLITDDEIDYTRSVLQKTYTALVENQLEVEETSYCDPFCRKITSVLIQDTKKVDTGTVIEDKLFLDSTASCTQELELTFAIGGTWVGCTGSESSFPGLFSIPSVTDNIFDDQKIRRQLSSTVSQHNLRHVSSRNLQDIEGCGVCPTDVDSFGMLAPSSKGLHEVMQPFITVLPAVCEIVSIELVESDVVVGADDNDADEEPTDEPVDNKAETGEPELDATNPPDSPTTKDDGTSGPWTPVDCPVSFGTENCVDLLTVNSDGAVPCECDGQCLIFAGGRFTGCSGDGGLSGLTGGETGSAMINAAGCTLAEHAVDIPGFTCSN